MQLQLSMAVADKLHETLLVRGEPLDVVEAARLLVSSPDCPVPLCRDVVDALVLHDQRFCWSKGNATGFMLDTPLAPGSRGDQWISLSHWELPDPLLTEVPFVALDLETTGARAGVSKITEVGAVRIEGLREVKTFGTLVNPLRPIPRLITQITGITQKMVADAPRIDEVIPELMEFLEGAVVVAHNASFDVGFLNYELRRLRGRRLGEGAIDTLPLARALAPGLPNYRLHTVAEALGAPVAACHRALADAQAAGHVFITLMERLQERGVTRLNEARVYASPSSRSAAEKLQLIRDLPRSPGVYRFLDREGQVLYVGQAEQMRERVRSHFVSNPSLPRKVRRAVRLVERVEWDETCTPLEAVIREQELILEHRPSCNLQGGRPEGYAYLRVGNSRAGLYLYMSSRAPSNSASVTAQRTREFAIPLVLGPFRGRSRLARALDLLQLCYPIRRCARHTEEHPCARGLTGRCLAPCTGNPAVRVEHDALVQEVVNWLASRRTVCIPDPSQRAEELMRDLYRKRRFEEARQLRTARDDLLAIRHAYASLVEARALNFVAMWPHKNNEGDLAVRLNVVCSGRMHQPVSLRPDALEQDIEEALARLGEQSDLQMQPAGPPGTHQFIAVPQTEHDTLLAIWRWFHEAENQTAVTLIADGPLDARIRTWKDRLLAEALRVLAQGTDSEISR